MVVFDLEDAVAESRRTEARSTVVEWLASVAGKQITAVGVNGVATARAKANLLSTLIGEVDAGCHAQGGARGGPPLRMS